MELKLVETVRERDIKILVGSMKKCCLCVTAEDKVDSLLGIPKKLFENKVASKNPERAVASWQGLCLAWGRSQISPWNVQAVGDLQDLALRLWGVAASLL